MRISMFFSTYVFASLSTENGVMQFSGNTALIHSNFCHFHVQLYPYISAFLAFRTCLIFMYCYTPTLFLKLSSLSADAIYDFMYTYIYALFTLNGRKHFMFIYNYT